MRRHRGGVPPDLQLDALGALSARIVDDGTRWHACIVRDLTRHRRPAKRTATVGTDPGVSRILTLSTGDVVTLPQARERRLRREPVAASAPPDPGPSCRIARHDTP